MQNNVQNCWPVEKNHHSLNLRILWLKSSSSNNCPQNINYWNTKLSVHSEEKKTSYLNLMIWLLLVISVCFSEQIFDYVFSFFLNNSFKSFFPKPEISQMFQSKSSCVLPSLPIRGNDSLKWVGKLKTEISWSFQIPCWHHCQIWNILQ